MGLQLLPGLLPGLPLADGIRQHGPGVRLGGAHHGVQLFQTHIRILRLSKLPHFLQVHQLAVNDHAVHVKNHCFYHTDLTYI